MSHPSNPLYPPPPHYLYREEESEDGMEKEEKEETPVTESDLDEADTVFKQTTPRYFRTRWKRMVINTKK